jgi:hypothetical protein
MFETAALAIGVGAVSGRRSGGRPEGSSYWAGGVISAMADRCRTMGGYCG